MKIRTSYRLQSYTLSIAAFLIGMAIIATPSVSFAQGRGDAHSNSDTNGNHYAYGHIKNPPGPPDPLNTPPSSPVPPAGPINSHPGNARGYGQNNGDDGNNGSNFWGNIFSRFGGFFGRKFGDTSTTTTTTTPPVPPVQTGLPPVISGVGSPTVLTVGQTGTWSVSASDPENGSLTYSVNWGDEGAQPLMADAMMNPFVQTSTFTHSYASAGTYTVTFSVEDSGGLTAVSTVTVHVVGQRQNDLVISDVSATSTRQHRATITWTTNESADSSVWISTSSPIDTSVAATLSQNSLVKNHSLVATKLAAGTTYYAIVGSTNSRGLSTTSAQISFTTPAQTNNAPTISSITGSSTIAAGVTGTWTVNASDPKNEALTYSINWGDNAPTPLFAGLFGKPFEQTSTFTHVYVNPGTYTITVTAEDTSGLSTTATASVDVTPTITPPATGPTISDVSSTVASTTVSVSWNTDESSDSELYYSTSSPVVIGASGTSAITDPTLVTDHTLTAVGLATSTTYNFIVESKDSSGNATTSPQFSTTTVSM